MVDREPDADELQLIRRSHVVQRMGMLSLSAGTGSYRVKASMSRIADALGIDRLEAQVTLTEITTTAHRGDSFRTEVAEVRRIGVNTDRLTALEHLAQWAETRGSCTVDEITQRLDAIAARPPLWAPWLNALFAGLACFAFAFLNNASVAGMCCALVGATVGQFVRRALVHRGYNQFGVVLLAAVVASSVFLGSARLWDVVGDPVAAPGVGFIAAVLFLVPGFPLVTGALDLAKSDFSAGITRLVYALMVFFTAAFGLWAVSVLAGITPSAPRPWLDEGPVLMVLRLAMTAVGVLGFALMFNGTPRLAISAALVAMVPNVLRIESMTRLDWPAPFAAAAAALLIGLLTKLVAGRIGVPKLAIYVPAVTIMVPGVPAYEAVYHLAQGDPVEALGFGVQASFVVVSLAMGLALARMVTDRQWRYDIDPPTH